MKKIFLPLLALLCLTLPARAADFYDLPANHWAGTEIRQALEAGVVNGYGDGSFQPGRNVTAAQFCAMLSRSFLSEEFAAAPEGKYQAMDACLPILKGTTVETAYQARGRHWDRFVNEPLTRYDMAQIIYNLILAKSAPEGPASSAGSIAGDIPERYRDAVTTCWGMGILKGRGDGSFAGEESLNRAQACVIWSRLDELFNGREVPEDPDAGAEVREMPAFGLQGEETVQEMMNRVNAATPACEEGRLPNGKARTEEALQELLELVKRGCPDGTVWSGTERYDYNVPGLGPTRGGLSFGMAVSDYLFGEGAPVTQHQRIPALAVGDVVHIRYESVERVLVITGVDREEDAYTACTVTKYGKVDWDEWGPISGLVEGYGLTTVYRRWK